MTILLVVFKDYLQIDLQLVMLSFSVVVCWHSVQAKQ